METRTEAGSIPEIPELIQLALVGLSKMYDREKSLFCYALQNGEFSKGVSERYSLICLIGLFRAGNSNYPVSFDLSRIFQRAAQISDPGVTDLGLLLWAGSLVGQKDLYPIYQNLSMRFNTMKSDRLLGMDVGVALSGLVAYARLTGRKVVYEMAKVVKDFIIQSHTHKNSHLFYHVGRNTFRRKLPNFASQIYLMYGLIHYSQLENDLNAAEYAEECLDTLRNLQRADGGWPWIYHVVGKVIEPYEIYSVHQDAMMPMVMQAMREVNSKSYDEALRRSLSWLSGGNGLGQDMIDAENSIIFRSLRRSRPLSEIIGGVNALCGYMFKRPLLHESNIEIDTSCRSYHFGWILEAWCGRENFG
jgi:hypothetical protein